MHIIADTYSASKTVGIETLKYLIKSIFPCEIYFWIAPSPCFVDLESFGPRFQKNQYQNHYLQCRVLRTLNNDSSRILSSHLFRHFLSLYSKLLRDMPKYSQLHFVYPVPKQSGCCNFPKCWSYPYFSSMIIPFKSQAPCHWTHHEEVQLQHHYSRIYSNVWLWTSFICRPSLVSIYGVIVENIETKVNLSIFSNLLQNRFCESRTYRRLKYKGNKP